MSGIEKKIFVFIFVIINFRGKSTVKKIGSQNTVGVLYVLLGLLYKLFGKCRYNG